MTDVTEIVASFVVNNRSLVSADLPEHWKPAAASIFEDLVIVRENFEQILTLGDNSESSRLVSMLLTILAEAGQYRHEQFSPRNDKENKIRKRIDNEFLPLMGELRREAISVLKKYLLSDPFASIHEDIKQEIFPLLDSMNPEVDPKRFMPFRIIQVANVVDRLYGFRLRTQDTALTGDRDQSGLLEEIYNRKYLRFGTSGFRGRWQLDFTESRANQIVQAICEFLSARNTPAYVGAEDLSGKTLVIGYDSRKNADIVSDWVAQIALTNGFEVERSSRDTPTPALVYYLTDYMPPEKVAGLINCTASHNPPEWQGIKFNPRLGYPAPTNITDYIAFRTNEIQLLNQSAQTIIDGNDNDQAPIKSFDPISSYSEWIINSGRGNSRISLDIKRIKDFFADKLVVIDEMYGAGRGYLTRLLSHIGIQFEVIHGEKNPDFPGLDYANPEEPYINELAKAVKESGAQLGLGLDADADRFGIVDKGGIYFRPNQILPMLVKYLGVDRKLQGRVIATQTGSPLIENLAESIPNNEKHKPEKGAVPLYVRHPFYKQIIGNKEDRIQSNTFLVPVGIKYIEEIRRLDRNYQAYKKLPENWRDTILIGGEESSGLTTRGHVTDKDGIWADLLVMDMLAYYSSETNDRIKTISDIWKETVSVDGSWISYGGKENQNSNSGRIDIDAVLEVKEALIDHFLESFNEKANSFADLDIVFLGGIKHDAAELQLRDPSGGTNHYLRVRSSGTEPINRIYIESSSSLIAQKLLEETLLVLQKITLNELKKAWSKWKLVDILSQTNPSQVPDEAILDVISAKQWQVEEITRMLTLAIPTLESRTRRLAKEWIQILDNHE